MNSLTSSWKITGKNYKKGTLSKMTKIIFIIIELIVLGISVIMIYDARKIATKTFSSNETNETTKVLKIVGFIALIISLLMIYITKIKM